MYSSPSPPTYDGLCLVRNDPFFLGRPDPFPGPHPRVTSSHTPIVPPTTRRPAEGWCSTRVHGFQRAKCRGTSSPQCRCVGGLWNRTGSSKVGHYLDDWRSDWRPVALNSSSSSLPLSGPRYSLRVPPSVDSDVEPRSQDPHPPPTCPTPDFVDPGRW